MNHLHFFFKISIAFSCIAFFASMQTNAAMLPSDTSIVNTLTAAEKQEGWKLLFDGKSLQGWRSYLNKPFSSWKVENGALVCASNKQAQAKHADLITDKQYKNFELSIDWKITPKSNSGIMYLVTEQYSESYESGPEYQIIDDNGYPENLQDFQKSGACYAMYAPFTLAAKPVGEWNTAKIIVNNKHVEHWLNGIKVVEYELGSEDWKERKAKDKWKNIAGYGAADKGHIALQDHNGDGNIYFRNIKIKTL